MSPPNSRCQKRDTKQVPDWAMNITDIWRFASVQVNWYTSAYVRVGIAINTLKMFRHLRKKCCPVVQASGYAWSVKPCDRTDAPTARGKISLNRGIHCCPNFLIFFFCPTSVSILWKICVCYIYTYLSAYRLYMNYRRCQTTHRVKHFCINR